MTCETCGGQIEPRTNGSGRQKRYCKRECWPSASRVPVNAQGACSECGKQMLWSTASTPRCASCRGRGRPCDDCGQPCNGRRCAPCREAHRDRRQAEWLAAQKAKAADLAMDALFDGLCRVARTIDAEKIPRAMTLVLDRAACDLGPWAFLDGDAESRTQILYQVADAIAAASMTNIGRRPDRGGPLVAQAS